MLFRGLRRKRLTLRGLAAGSLVFLLSLLTVPALLALVVSPVLALNLALWIVLVLDALNQIEGEPAHRRTFTPSTSALPPAVGSMWNSLAPRGKGALQ